MLSEMTSRQLTEWAAYYAVDPWGDERQDYRVAHALAVIVGMFRGEDTGPISVSDFIPRVGALAYDDDRADGDENDLQPPKPPGVAWFEQMMGM